MGRAVYWASFGASAGARRETPFERERRAFRLLLPKLKDHEGNFVAVHDGAIAAFDKSRNGVLRKFFAQYPIGTSVYVGFVGPTPIARVSAPAFARS